jgi:hypothetical protein
MAWVALSVVVVRFREAREEDDALWVGLGPTRYP